MLCTQYSFPRMGWNPRFWSFLCFSGNTSFSSVFHWCLILLGCRSVPQSLLYNTLSRISVHYNQSLPLCTGKMYTEMPIDLKNITDFEANCSKARKLLLKLTPFLTWMDCDRTFNCFTEHDIFLLQAQVIQTQLFGGPKKNQQSYLANSYLIYFFPLCTMYLQVLVTSMWLRHKLTNIFLAALPANSLQIVWSNGGYGEKAPVFTSGSEHLKSEISPEYVITLTKSSPVTVTKLCL